ncbi:hypothetical protein D3C75_997630 [compost metagenome]
MVGNHGGDLHVQLALLVAVQQVGQTVVELADHQQHAHRLGGVVQAEHGAHEEGAADLVVELRHLADVATVVGEEGSHAGDDAGSGRAADLDHVLVLSVLHVESSGGGGSGCKAENLSVKPEFIPEYF